MARTLGRQHRPLGHLSDKSQAAHGWDKESLAWQPTWLEHCSVRNAAKKTLN